MENLISKNTIDLSAKKSIGVTRSLKHRAKKKSVSKLNSITLQKYELAKVHKEGHPMRPVVTSISTPMYYNFFKSWSLDKPIAIFAVEQFRFSPADWEHWIRWQIYTDIIGTLSQYSVCYHDWIHIIDLLEEAKVPENIMSEVINRLEKDLKPNVFKFNGRRFNLLPTWIKTHRNLHEKIWKWSTGLSNYILYWHRF